MSQAKAPASPKQNLRRNQAPYPNVSLDSDSHVNPGTEPVSAKPVVSDYSDLATTAVASTTVSAPGTLKRPREEDYGEVAEAGTSTDVPEAKRRVKATHDVIYRIVVPSRQIGKVIGKAGHRIQKIREETQATIKIADAISFFLDR